MTTHILIVDDEPDAQELFRQNFRRAIRKGVYSFEVVESGAAALAVIAARSPVVVLSDINMPGMSGIELPAELQESRRELPVMMITAYGDAATEARVQALGAHRFLTKPVDIGQPKDVFACFSGAPA